MGGRSSSLLSSSSPSIDVRCEWCGTLTVDAKVKGEFTVCSRCSGVVGRKRGGGSRRSLGSSAFGRSTAAADEEKGDGAASVSPSSLSQPALQLIHVLPFQETLPASETSPTEPQMLSQYLTPYFASRQGLYVTAGQRFQISEVDWKVTACFPPAGQMTASTVIRCMYPPLHALTELKRLHVLPTLASLPQGQPPPSSQNLFHDYLKPYFVPSASSSSSSSSSSSRSGPSVPPPQHHLAVGDSFMSRGLQFKVIACVPSDGLVTTSCDIFVEGEPLRDVVRVAILPIYESLPNNEKAITAEQVVERYLHPFFSGRFQVVKRNDSLDIDGVTFRVTACEPETGLVTMGTQIFAEGEPLRADELRRQQEVEDEELARRMQQQEARDQGYPVAPLPFGGGALPGFYAPPLPRRANNPQVSADELRLRLLELYRQMPEHDNHRIIIRRMLDTLPQNHGATRRDIDALPTRVFTARAEPTPPLPSRAVAAHGSDEKAEKKEESGGAKEENREHLMCMVPSGLYRRVAAAQQGLSAV